MEYHFTKMHGLGNDFVVFDFTQKPYSLTPEQIRSLADRRFGVGCDQILVLEASHNPEADVRYRIFNADGGEVEQCGNGARCIAVFLRSKGLVDKDVITAETVDGLLQLYFEADDQIRVNMGIPRFQPQEIPMDFEQQQDLYTVQMRQGPLSFAAVSMGNPHAVIRVEDIKSTPVTRLGPELQRHSMFPQGVNVGFMQIHDAGNISLRVYERGAGETLACGSGACAAVVAGRKNYDLNETVNVRLTGGNLMITWQGGDNPVWMTGPAVIVYEGKITI